MKDVLKLKDVSVRSLLKDVIDVYVVIVKGVVREPVYEKDVEELFSVVEVHHGSVGFGLVNVHQLTPIFTLIERSVSVVISALA